MNSVVQTRLERGRLRAYTILPREEGFAISPWKLLRWNFGSAIRHGLILDGSLFLGIDSVEMSEDEPNCLVKQLQIRAKYLQKRGVSFAPGNWNPWKSPPFLRNLNLSIFSDKHFRVYHDGTNRVVCALHLPFIRIQTGVESSPAECRSAPAYFACFCNSRIHFGNLYYSAAGWGVCCYIDLNNSSFLRILQHFEHLCNKIRGDVWEKIQFLYHPRLAQEFLERNRFPRQTFFDDFTERGAILQISRGPVTRGPQKREKTIH